VLRFPPKVSAHTAAEGLEKAIGVVVVPSLGLRDEILWRGGLGK